MDQKQDADGEISRIGYTRNFQKDSSGCSTSPTKSRCLERRCTGIARFQFHNFQPQFYFQERESTWDRFFMRVLKKLRRKNGTSLWFLSPHKEDVHSWKIQATATGSQFLARILPQEFGWGQPTGVDYYNNLIDELLANGIHPWSPCSIGFRSLRRTEPSGGWRRPRLHLAICSASLPTFRDGQVVADNERNLHPLTFLWMGSMPRVRKSSSSYVPRITSSKHMRSYRIMKESSRCRGEEWIGHGQLLVRAGDPDSEEDRLRLKSSHLGWCNALHVWKNKRWKFILDCWLNSARMDGASDSAGCYPLWCGIRTKSKEENFPSPVPTSMRNDGKVERLNGSLWFLIK